jgi:Ser/Thr protein kinase RdoA (MazF antagonist)
MHRWAASTQSGVADSIHGGAVGQREQFAADELSAVLAHYDLGEISSVQEFPRGSRRSPKVVITAAQGKFLLKRRAPGKNDPRRVTFSHAIQLHLAEHHFPLPRLIGTKSARQTFTQWNANIYELFEFVSARGYPGTLDFSPPWHPPAGGYHRADIVFESIQRIETAGQTQKEVMEELKDAYTRAADVAAQAGLPSWPKQIVHADWHPGNLLFHADRVAAVLDYDAARQLARATDIGNGVLQFSILDSESDVAHWPDFVDESRYRRFLRGYHGVAPLSTAESQSLPPLMVEALIAEAVVPIAATGTFGRTAGADFLRMVLRKVRWISTHSADLIEIAEK